jgi:hypothetical protein
LFDGTIDWISFSPQKGLVAPFPFLGWLQLIKTSPKAKLLLVFCFSKTCQQTCCFLKNSLFEGIGCALPFLGEATIN